MQRQPARGARFEFAGRCALDRGSVPPAPEPLTGSYAELQLIREQQAQQQHARERDQHHLHRLTGFGRNRKPEQVVAARGGVTAAPVSALRRRRLGFAGGSHAAARCPACVFLARECGREAAKELRGECRRRRAATCVRGQSQLAQALALKDSDAPDVNAQCSRDRRGKERLRRADAGPELQSESKLIR